MRPVDRVAGLRLVAPVRGGVARRRERALEVHRDHRVPLATLPCWRACGRAGCRRCSRACRGGRTCRSRAAPCGPRRRSRRRSRRRRRPRRPCALISSTTSIAGLSDPPSPCMSPPRSFTTTLAPSAAYASACSRPIPRPDPVTMTTRPSQIPMLSSSFPRRVGAARAAGACRACRCRAGAAPRRTRRGGDTCSARCGRGTTRRARRRARRTASTPGWGSTDGDHDLAPFVVGHADDADVADRRMADAAPPRPRPDRCSRRR